MRRGGVGVVLVGRRKDFLLRKRELGRVVWGGGSGRRGWRGRWGSEWWAVRQRVCRIV